MARRGREQGFGTFRPSRGFPGAPGNGGTDFLQGLEIPVVSWMECAGVEDLIVAIDHYLPSRGRNAPFLPVTPTTSFSCGEYALYKAHFIARAFRGEDIRRVRQDWLPAPVKVSALPVTASFHRPSRRENGGLCPNPLKGPDP